jgi:hypothetical protein
VRIRIEGDHLPGLVCGPGPDFPDGHSNVHVAVQGRRGRQDLLGLVPGDAPSAVWDVTCEIVSSGATVDFRGPQIQGSPHRRFIYLTWGVVADDRFTMFRRAKIWLDTVPAEILAQAVERGLLVANLGLTDDHGWPLCASIRPPLVAWGAP